jgi:hypothetical protein
MRFFTISRLYHGSPSDILVLDPSIITSANNMLIPAEPSSFRSSDTIILYTSESVTFKYLTKNSFCEVQILIRKMGRVLGWKKCVLLIDSLIADVYDMFLDRTRLYGVNHDKYHGDWISSKCGVLLTVNEVSVVSFHKYFVCHPFKP